MLESLNIPSKLITYMIEQFDATPEEILHDNLIHLNYPGSDKGMRPEDDMESFQKFYYKNISDSMFKFLYHINDIV